MRGSQIMCNQGPVLKQLCVLVHLGSNRAVGTFLHHLGNRDLNPYASAAVALSSHIHITWLCVSIRK